MPDATVAFSRTTAILGKNLAVCKSLNAQPIVPKTWLVRMFPFVVPCILVTPPGFEQRLFALIFLGPKISTCGNP